MKAIRFVFVTFVILSFSTGLKAEKITADYLAGYAKGVLKAKFDLQAASVRADGHTVTISLPQEQADLQELIRSSLASLPDRVQVRFEPGPSLETPNEQQLEVKLDRHEFLPDNPLFEPIIADPRWPHFSASYQSYMDREDIKNVGHTSFTMN